MIISISVAIVAFVALVWILRRDRVSLGLPVAYMASLLLIHLPGALAHVFGGRFLMNSDLVEVGMRFAALGAACFPIGVWLARRSAKRITLAPQVDRPDFWHSCLIAGWILMYGLSPLYHIPSLSAAMDKGGAIWILGVLLALRAGFRDGNVTRVLVWFGALLVYPVVMLLLGGFLSYGSQAMIFACSVLVVSTRSRWRTAVGAVVVAIIGISTFVNYFEYRGNIRHEVWGGASLSDRIDSVAEVFENFEVIDLGNPQHLAALDERLNQNYFTGLAAERIQRGQVQYLNGLSLWEGVVSLVPRVFWPEKPVYAGSPMIVAQMTGLPLSMGTSFGVGNVMEFQINFGVPGVIIGFLALGWLIGTIDLKAAVAENRGDLGHTIVLFLPTLALIDPQGSLVQMFSGAAAALIAAYGWKWLWHEREMRRAMQTKMALRPLSLAIRRQ